MNRPLGGALIIVCVVIILCAAVAVNAQRRASEAVASARRAARAAEVAQRHCDGLVELLAELSPTARRAWLASREYRSPAVAAAHRRLFAFHGYRIDEGTP